MRNFEEEIFNLKRGFLIFWFLSFLVCFCVLIFFDEEKTFYRYREKGRRNGACVGSVHH